MPHNLSGQIVKQIGIVFVGDIGEIDQAADDIILGPLLKEIALRHPNRMPLVAIEILRP